MSRTLKLTIAYDGTAFAGWQRQAGQRTVQADIEDALKPIEGGRAVVHGAGRTDAGVHAAGQVASVTLTAGIAIPELLRALNATLLGDVRILRIEEASPDFNARFDARAKTYHYDIWSVIAGLKPRATDPLGSPVARGFSPACVVPPSLRHFVWHVPQPLDIDAMNEAAAVLCGEHDFAAFQAAGGDVKTTVREVLVSQVAPVSALGLSIIAATSTGDWLRYEITGTGFLRHMVRNIVGTLVDIGRHRRSVDDMRTILESCDRARASATAPPHGLSLWEVSY